MALVFRIGALRVVVFTNDHPPPHVHVVGPDRTAKFALNAPDGPVALVEHIGFRIAELNTIAAEIARHYDACCAKWRTIHGAL